MRVPGWIVAGLLLHGCGDSSPASSPCEGDKPQCVDAGALSVCEDGIEEVTSCAEICGEDDPVGCLEQEGEHACDCSPPTEECEPDTQACEWKNSWWVCGGGTKIHFSCQDLCGVSPDPIPLGCYLDLSQGIEECQCGQAGDPCDHVAPLCAGGDALATCEEGVWQVQSCADVCGNADATCDWDIVLNRGACDC